MVGGKSRPFTLPRAYAWVTYPLGDQFVPEYAGFAIRIPITPTLAELRATDACLSCGNTSEIELHEARGPRDMGRLGHG